MKPRTDPRQALQTIKTVCRAYRGTYDEHVLLSKSLDELELLIGAYENKGKAHEKVDKKSK